MKNEFRRLNYQRFLKTDASRTVFFLKTFKMNDLKVNQNLIETDTLCGSRRRQILFAWSKDRFDHWVEAARSIERSCCDPLIGFHFSWKHEQFREILGQETKTIWKTFNAVKWFGICLDKFYTKKCIVMPCKAYCVYKNHRWKITKDSVEIVHAAEEQGKERGASEIGTRT